MTASSVALDEDRVFPMTAGFDPFLSLGGCSRFLSISIVIGAIAFFLSAYLVAGGGAGVLAYFAGTDLGRNF